jgi:hypothetical protein
MPDPTEYNSEKEWMSACMPRALDEGLDQEQAQGKCMGMWGKKGEAGFVLDLDALFPAAKSGRRHSHSDHKHLQQAIEEIKLAGGDHPAFHPAEPPTNYTREVVEMKALTDNTGIVLLTGIPWGAIKAAGDMTLEVLGIPFGGPDKGKDKQGQYFSARTKTYLDAGKTIPVFYYHGYSDKGKPEGDPVAIGTAKFERTDSKGHWFSVQLDRAKELAVKVWEAAKKGLAKASSGAVSHLVRLADDGEILNWVIGELSVFDTYNGKEPANAYAVALPVMKSLYQAAGVEYSDPLPENEETIGGAKGVETPGIAAKSLPATNSQERLPQEVMMDATDVTKLVAEALAKHELDRKAAEDAAKADALKFEQAVQAEAAKRDAAVERRIPGGMPYVAKYGYSNKWDGLNAADTAIVISVLESSKHLPNTGKVSDGALKSLALKLNDEKSEAAELGRRALKATGLKADEISYSTLSSYGDDWVGVAYSQALWESIRLNTFVVNKLPSVEVPQGYESIYLPLESTDPTWYKVAQASSSATSYAGPTPTVTATLAGSARVQMTLAKMGARIVWTGEMDEDSLIPYAGQMRTQLGVSGAEYLESALIDGDTETTASTNVNDIAGTPASTDWFLVWDGFRKSCLVTTSANSRSAAGSLDVTDYLETVKLMGTGGINGFDTSKVGFIIDVPTHYKTLTLPEVLTRDVASSPTIEGGRVTRLWGYDINVSAQMCKHSGYNLSEATGKVDEDNPTHNLYGSILAVRWDQWKFGWRRRMTMESMRWPASDSTEIVAMLRCGLIQKDTEASAISYYVGA